MIDLSNNNVIHKKGKEVEYLQFKRLLEYPELVHAYTLKINKFDIAGNDTIAEKKESVISNYIKLANELEFDYNHIIRPYQTHTDIVKSVTNDVNSISIFPVEYENVDGLITNKSEIAFSLSYADCIPLFFYDPIKKVIGNIHSGWKGTFNKIGAKAVSKMAQEYDCNPKNIICCIGPSIRKCHFEVGNDVYKMFYEKFLYTGEIDKIIHKKEDIKDKYYIDTVLINKIILKELGLKEENIIDSEICTVCNAKLMHSYRAMGKNSGRNTGVIGRFCK